MSLLDTHLEDGIAVLTLNDPERRNAFTLDLVSAIIGAMDFYEREGNCGAVIVTGAGPAFCAGADLGHLAGATSNDLLEIYAGFLRIAQSPLPTIAAVNGPAVGAGMNLALACDVRITAESGRFDARFLQLGVHPGGGHTWMLSRIAGPQTAAAMVLFSETVTGPEAVARGLAWQAHEGDARRGRSARHARGSGRQRAGGPALVHRRAGVHGAAVGDARPDQRPRLSHGPVGKVDG
jgi:enoyl-CoA hydratase